MKAIENLERDDSGHEELFDPDRVLRASWPVMGEGGEMRVEHYDLPCTMTQSFADSINHEGEESGVGPLFVRWEDVDLSGLRQRQPSQIARTISYIVDFVGRQK